MRKKILLIAAITAMTFSLCACDKEDSNNTTATDYEALEVDYDEISSNFDALNDAANDKEESTEAEENIIAERGSVEDNVFTNETFDISFPIEDSYYVYTDEMIAQLVGLSAEAMEDNGVISAEAYEEAASGCIYDFMFAFEDQQSNVSIIYQNTTSMPNGDQLTAQSYAEMTKYQLESMSSPVYTIADPTTATYGGHEYACIDAKTDQGYSQMQLVRMQGNYVIAITITYVDGADNLCTDFLNSLTTAQ